LDCGALLSKVTAPFCIFLAGSAKTDRYFLAAQGRIFIFSLAAGGKRV
jgi:hypothetical protein